MYTVYRCRAKARIWLNHIFMAPMMSLTKFVAFLLELYRNQLICYLEVNVCVLTYNCCSCLMWSVLKLCSKVIEISRIPTRTWRRPISRVNLVFSENVLEIYKCKWKLMAVKVWHLDILLVFSIDVYIWHHSLHCGSKVANSTKEPFNVIHQSGIRCCSVIYKGFRATHAYLPGSLDIPGLLLIWSTVYNS